MLPKPPHSEIILQGVPASPGVAHGSGYLFFHKELEIPIYNIEPAFQPDEIKRFEKALLDTRIQINNVRNEVAQKLGEDEAKIFDAHLLVIEDKALIEHTIKEHQQFGYNMEYCFHAVAKRYIEAFDHIDDEYIKERVADIRDVTKRVLHNLLGHTHAINFNLTAPKILISEDIAPSDTAGIDRSMVLAIVTDTGSRTSHAVIMARSLKVPAVVGLHDISSRVQKEDTLLVDGYDGIVIINPTEETLYRYGKLKIEKEYAKRIYDSAIHLPTETLDGKRIKIFANIEGGQDLPSIHESYMDGVGLFRTESLFLRKEPLPTEEEQFRIYKSVAESLSPAGVVIRTLDIGGDKTIDHFSFSENESNPFMGFRAIRFCLEHQSIFKEQLRAILRASTFGKIKIMYPMISSVQEIKRANALLEEVKVELQESGYPFDPNIEVGCMIEIPSAALTIDSLSKNAQFFSIGTNDLIQYMLAVDRGNDKIAHLYEPHHPAIIRILQHIIEESDKKGIPVSICGEIASDPLFVPLLIGLGASELSIAPGFTSEIRYLIRSIKYTDAKILAKKILKLDDSTMIFEALQDFYRSKTRNMPKS